MRDLIRTGNIETFHYKMNDGDFITIGMIEREI